jgi:hypothetical protein
VTTLVYHQVYQAPEWKEWPAELRLWLEQCSKAEVAKELLCAHHLIKILEAFLLQGIKPLLMKGEALARTHYPVPGSRARADSDLFIHFDDIQPARNALVECGFSIDGSIYKSHQLVARRIGHDQAPVEFDIHWRILNAPRFARSISFDEAMSRSIVVPGLDDCRTLNVVDALMLACMHRVGSDWHDQDRLIWVYDIHTLVTAMSEQELQQFSILAVERNIQSACYAGLAKARACFRTKISSQVMGVLETAEIPNTLSRRFAESQLGLLIDDLKCLPDRRSRWALFRELFYPSGASLLQKYGKQNKIWLPWLYLKQIFGGTWARLTLR